MILNGQALLRAAPLDPMIPEKRREYGVSFGLAEAGIDVRVQQEIRFTPPDPVRFFDTMSITRHRSTAMKAFHGFVEVDGKCTIGRFAIASTVERFEVPRHLLAIMGHKSTWARQGVNVWAGTTAEPGWGGWLTLEIGFHGTEPVHIPAGSGIAQVHFHELAEAGDYAGGKYANQPARPIAAIMERG